MFENNEFDSPAITEEMIRCSYIDYCNSNKRAHKDPYFVYVLYSLRDMPEYSGDANALRLHELLLLALNRRFPDKTASAIHKELSQDKMQFILKTAEYLLDMLDEISEKMQSVTNSIKKAPTEELYKDLGTLNEMSTDLTFALDILKGLQERLNISTVKRELKKPRN